MNRKSTDYLVIHRAECDFEDYHAVVERDGSVKWYMDRDAHGAAVKNYNSVALSVALVGDFCTADAAKAIHGTPTDAQWQAAVTLIAQLVSLYPQAKLVGHTELGPGATMYVKKLTAPQSCPGTRFDLDKFRKEVADIVAQSQPNGPVCA